MRFERTIAALAGLVLASAGASFVLEGRWPWGLLASPPLLMGAGAAGVAAARGPLGRSAASLIVRATLVASAIVYAMVGLLLVLPAIVVGLVASGFLGFVTADPAATRPPRTVIATGALWTIVFGLFVCLGGAPLGVHVALGASLALGLAGVAWLRELERAGRVDLLPARAVARP